MTVPPEQRIEVFGTEDEPAAATLLRAGPLSAEFEGGNLRYLRWGGVEVLRAVSFLIRDTAWSTYSPQLTAVEMEGDDAGFRVRYSARCSGPEGSFSYRASIDGSARGVLTFSAEGSSEADFPTNRLGFVVLHPLEGVAGAEVAIEHTDGNVETVTLPVHIAPDQPAFDIRVITHQAAPGIRVRVEMLGDAYEMEDQRNWTDASFKTYVRPLSKPRPYLVPAGEVVRQSITLRVEGPARRGAGALRSDVTIRIGEASGTMPAVALACDPDEVDEALAAASILRAAGLRRLSFRYDPARGHGPDTLAAAERLRSAIGADLTLEAVVAGRDPEGELARLAADIRAAGLTLRALVPAPRRDLKTRPSNTLPAGEAAAAAIYRAARTALPGVAIGGGMLTNFTELNRNRPPPEAIDFVTHATCATVHAADDRSVMETLQALPHIFRSTRAFMGEALPYRIALAAIGANDNPYGPSVSANPENRRVTLARADPRQRGSFAAAFALAYAALAAGHGVAEIGLGHIAGPLGVVGESGPRPLFAIVAALVAAGGNPHFSVSASAPGISALAFRQESGTILIVANTTDDVLEVTPPAGFGSADEQGSPGAAVSSPIRAPAYGVVRLARPAG